MIAAIARHSRLLYVLAITPLARYIRSAMPITDTMEDSLMMVTNSLPNAGRIFFTACGRMTNFIASP